MNGRINGIHIVDNVKPASTIGIALPISNVFAIRTPTESVTTTEFFFIHPIESTIHNLFIAILCELNYLTISQSFYINVVFRNIRHSGSVRRELGKHQSSFRSVLAQLLQFTALDIQHPIVTTGIVTPYLTGIGIDQYLVVITTESKTTHTNRFPCIWIHQLISRNQHFLGIIFGTISHHIKTTVGIPFNFGVMFPILHPVHITASFRTDQTSIYGFLQSRNVLRLHS